MKVSVVIPVFNPGPYLEPCLRSLLEQSLPDRDYEIICVDDGSSDGTSVWLDDAARRYPQVRVHHEPRNSG